MSSKRLHLTLFQKALILVAVPLAFELFLLGTVTWLLFQAEAEAARAEHAKTVIAKTTEAVQLIFDVGEVFVAYDARTNEIMGKRLNAILQQIPQSLNALQELLSDDPKHLAVVQQAADDTRGQMRILMNRKRIVENGGSIDIMEALNMRKTQSEIVNHLDSVITDYKEAQRADPDSASRFDEKVKLALLIGVVVSILLALVLVWRFHLSTTRRLHVLMDNSMRLGAGMPLGPRLEGRDEIAQIDLRFHESADELREANQKRMEVEQQKQQFIAMISHDLRTPLSAVKSTLELLGAGVLGDLSEKALQKVGRAEDNLRHTIDLINNLLDLDKVESGKMELTIRKASLAVVLERSASAVSSLADSRSITIELPDKDAELMIDERRFSQVVINLLGNAIKFSPDGTKIVIGAQQIPRRFKVTVTDQGRGIPPAQKASIFDRFHQVSPADEAERQGSGLGLAICKAIIEAHGGAIGVESEVGKGSTFWLTVPYEG